jgi:agmatinase
MPATGTPEPGGLSWPEITALLRKTAERRKIVGADIVELSPIPGMVAPSFLCARLTYKLLTYCFASDPAARRL